MDIKQVIQKWITALRSGEYIQTNRRLKRDDCFCALGVLCDILVKEGRGSWEYEVTSKVYQYCNGEFKSASFLPDDISSEMNRFFGHPVDSLASGLNDYGRDFNYIAEKIERLLPKDIPSQSNESLPQS